MADAFHEGDFSDVAVIVVAAGRGLRAGGATPKQYRAVAGRPLLAFTLDALAHAVPGACVQPVIDLQDGVLFDAVVGALDSNARDRLLAPVGGGATRQASVRAGLERLADAKGAAPRVVLIHDAARPFVDKASARRGVAMAREGRAAAPGLPVADTIKQIDAEANVVATPDRAALRAVQTPQAFPFAAILDAHRRAAASGLAHLTDDCAVAEWAGMTIAIYPGSPEQFKVTEPQDFARAEAHVLKNLDDIRTGQGFDVHAFGPGDHVWLGGVRIPHERGLVGHSDADVAMHAITDAIYGALGDGDIGAHFPPSDPQWRGAASDIFLRHAAELVRKRQGRIAHVDATIICEEPKVGPHREAIRERLAAILDLEIGRVAVKATTSERLGFPGRREGIAAMAIATVRLPSV